VLPVNCTAFPLFAQGAAAASAFASHGQDCGSRVDGRVLALLLLHFGAPCAGTSDPRLLRPPGEASDRDGVPGTRQVGHATHLEETRARRTGRNVQQESGECARSGDGFVEQARGRPWPFLSITPQFLGGLPLIELPFRHMFERRATGHRANARQVPLRLAGVHVHARHAVPACDTVLRRAAEAVETFLDADRAEPDLRQEQRGALPPAELRRFNRSTSRCPV